MVIDKGDTSIPKLLFKEWGNTNVRGVSRGAMEPLSILFLYNNGKNIYFIMSGGNYKITSRRMKKEVRASQMTAVHQRNLETV